MLEKKINLIRRFFYYFYGEKFFKRLDYSWANYPTRSEVIQKIINKAVDEVRKSEVAREPLLKKTKYIFLKNKATLTNEQQEKRFCRKII